jgi:hypothetical protein
MLMNATEFPNNGFCLAFDPFLEDTMVTPAQCVTFFSQHTGTWYEPYLETSYKEYISDDRNNFYLDKVNHIFLYSNIGGSLVNLNKLPTCKVTGNYENGEEFEVDCEVEQVSKGVYKAQVLIPSFVQGGLCIKPNRMLHDTWDNLEYFNLKDRTGITL